MGQEPAFDGAKAPQPWPHFLAVWDKHSYRPALWSNTWCQVPSTFSMSFWQFLDCLAPQHGPHGPHGPLGQFFGQLVFVIFIWPAPFLVAISFLFFLSFLIKVPTVCLDTPKALGKLINFFLAFTKATVWVQVIFGKFLAVASSSMGVESSTFLLLQL